MMDSLAFCLRRQFIAAIVQRLVTSNRLSHVGTSGHPTVKQHLSNGYSFGMCLLIDRYTASVVLAPSEYLA
jgi:hypothetical protein